ncbi:MAG TPA: transglycosylase domain-containing protein [Candidatus Phocaeicola excrementigallinarum]|nr:transglycosylase domain-containing protein [Candidatus Phocaeicola excrementigallinarum]
MNFISQVKKDLDILKKIIPQESTKIESLLTNVSADKLVNFLIVAEDHRYKYHIGFDVIAIFRAILKHVVYNTSEGASTIEQQLVRVIINDYTRSLSRKIKEIILASYVKLVFDKRILALIYLNIAYYGTQYQSLEAILRKYDLTKKDAINDCICAEIVARLKYPEPLVCSVHRKKQIEIRVKHVLYLYNKYSKQKIFFI